MKNCPKCKKAKDEREFNRNKTTGDGLASYCRACASALNKKWRDENKGPLKRPFGADQNLPAEESGQGVEDRMREAFDKWWSDWARNPEALANKEVAWQLWKSVYQRALNDAVELASQPRIFNAWPWDGHQAVENYAAAIRRLSQP